MIKAESGKKAKSRAPRLVLVITATSKIVGILAIWPVPYKDIFKVCCSKVIMSGVNGNVIMSGCGDGNPDDERRETVRDNTNAFPK
jgi:hypothetical protein